MPRLAWLTPDTAPTDTICRSLTIPASFEYLAIVCGALLELTQPENWEEFGTATVQDCVDTFTAMFDKFSVNEGPCRMIGEIILWPSSTSPNADWLACDGSSLLRSDYPDLFAIIGTIYGSADGSHFSLPDTRGRVAIGVGTGPGLSSYSIGDSIGEETHTLSTAETPSHTHSDTGHTHGEGIALPAVGAAIVGIPIPSAIPSAGITGIGFAGLSSAGGGGSHNNIQPVLALTYLIVAR